jgi:hypothetical protein
MPDTNNTASVRTWLRRCPAIERARKFGVDYLAEDGSYSLDATPTALKYQENILGEMVLQNKQEQNFVFASRDPYGDEFQQNLDNLGVMQDVSAWITGRNNARDFPDWEGGEVVGIVPTISGYPISMGSAFARYQIQIKVTYRVA